MNTDQTANYPTEVVLVRHGQSELNIRRAIAEQAHSTEERLSRGLRDADVPLTEIGTEQSRQTGRALAHQFEKFDIAFVSPHLRTRQTFEAMQDQFGYEVPVNYEDRVREKEFGIISQYTPHGIRKHFPQEAERLELEGAYYYRPLGGESYPDIGMRLHSFMHSLYQHQVGRRVLVVTHAAVVAMIRKMLERFSEAEMLQYDGLTRGPHEVKNCGVTVYRYNAAINYLKLTEYNKVYYD